MIPKNYSCEGQLSIWDLLDEKPEEICVCEAELCEHEDLEFTPCWDASELDNEFPPLDPDIASGKRKPYEYTFERYKGMRVKIYLDSEHIEYGRITAFDEYYTEVESDDGEEYALTCHNVAPSDRFEDSLPELDEIIPILTAKYGLKFKVEHWEWLGLEDDIVYIAKTKQGTLEIYTDHFFGNKQRFISIDYTNKHGSGAGCPATTIQNIYSFIEHSIKKTDDWERERRGRKED